MMELLLWTCKRWADTFLESDYPGGLFIEGLGDDARTKVELYAFPSLREGKEMADDWDDEVVKLRVTIEEVKGKR